MKILLAVDSSAASQIAVDEVASRPWPQGTSVEVVSATDAYSVWDAPGVSDVLFQAADQSVRATAERVKASGLPCTSHVLAGDPKSVLVDYAAEWGADLVVIGSHEHSDVMRFLQGSVARRKRSTRPERLLGTSTIRPHSKREGDCTSCALLG
jgi:nucleotide-binding universal stress UspA family protein